jgi:hypothetical protein
MAVLKIIVVVMVLVVSIVFFTLIRNGANLLEPPGMVKRAAVFFTVTSASTLDDHPFKELRTPVFNMDTETLYHLVIESANGLGWGIIAHDSDTYNANFVVRSPLLLFEDDVYVQVRHINANQSSLYIQSNSRSPSAHADFAANSGHIQDLIDKLREQ